MQSERDTPTPYPPVIVEDDALILLHIQRRSGSYKTLLTDINPFPHFWYNGIICDILNFPVETLASLVREYAI